MKEYIVTIVGTALFCGFIEMLSPEGNGGGIKKHIKLLSSLCVLCALIAPLVSFAEKMPEYDWGEMSSAFGGEAYRDEYDEICNNSITSYTESELESICEDLIFRELKLGRESFDVEVEAECLEGEITVRSATVVLYTGAIAQNPRTISGLVSEFLGCKCEIVYE